MWDTGASETHISRKVKDHFNLDDLDFDDVSSLGVTHVCSFHLAELRLPNGIAFPDLKVCCSDLDELNIDVLIGMDVISQGDLSLRRCADGIQFTFSV